MISSPSHLVQILLPKETGQGRPIGKEWFDGFLEELTGKFGGATSFSNLVQERVAKTAPGIRQ